MRFSYNSTNILLDKNGRLLSVHCLLQKFHDKNLKKVKTHNVTRMNTGKMILVFRKSLTDMEGEDGGRWLRERALINHMQKISLKNLQ